MPTVLVGFSKSFHGKFILIILTIIITYYNITGGILMAMLIIFLEEFNYEHNNNPIIYEGFEGETISNIGFRGKNCKGKILVDEDGDKVYEEYIGDVFPEIKFKSTKCNPCDENCKYKVTSQNEKLSMMEAMRSENSNNWPLVDGGGNKNIDSNEKQVESFTNIFSAFTDNGPEPEAVMLKMSK